MPIPSEHVDAVSDIPQLEDRDAWLLKLLKNGMRVKLSDLPEPQWMMPGERLGQSGFSPVTGPQRCRYMVVAAAPDYEDYNMRRPLQGKTGRILAQALVDADFELSDVYYTTVTRFPRPYTASSIKQSWLKPGWQYLLEEIKQVQPEAIIFLGSEACKLAYGNRTVLDSVRGQIRDFQGIPSTGATSHLSFVSNTAGLGTFVEQLRFFRQLGVDQSLKALDGLSYPGRDYKALNTLDEIRQEVEIEQSRAATLPQGRWYSLSIDVETGTDTGRPDDDYIITVQWSHGPNHARVIPLYVERPEPIVQECRTTTSKVKGYKKGDPVFDENGEPLMVPKWGGSGVDRKSENDRVAHYDQAVDLVRQLFDIPNLRVIGHNLRGDLKWLRDCFGIPVRRFMNAQRMRDTMLCYHLLEKDEYGLKPLVLRFTNMGAFDAPMQQWILDNSGAGKLFPGQKEDRFFYGYRDVPYKYLLPYACCDVDGTYRVSEAVHEILHQPGNEELMRLYYHIELPVQHGILDIETYGLPADQERLEELSDIYHDKYEELLDQLRRLIKWPTFNPNSPKNVPALLYAGPYKGWQGCEASRPDGAYAAGLPPVFTTGKYPRDWQDVVVEGETEYFAPACSDDALAKLQTQGGLDEMQQQVIQLLRDISAVKNFTTTFLRKPVFDDLAIEAPRYGKGLIASIDKRGRVCSRISTTSETGRWKHSEPNLANLPKNQEAEVARFFEQKIPKLRTGFCANPGWAIMEADFKSAELFVMGYMSGDPAFIQVLESGHDVHGYNAVNVFKLDCQPNEVKEKHPERRAATKTVVFGMAYGLSVSGLADKLTVELKRLVTVQEAQEILDMFFTSYPVLKQFFEGLKESCEHLGYVKTAYGRRRYFPGVTKLGGDKLAAAKREAMNAPIQGTVADALNVGLINLDRMRWETEIGRKIGWEVGIGIHDALIVHYPKEYTHEMALILRQCLSIWTPLPVEGAKCLDVDVEYGDRWQEFEEYKLTA